MHKERVHNYKPGPKIPKKSQKEEKSPKPEKKEKPPKLLRSPGKHHQTMPPNHLKPKYIRVGPPLIAPKQVKSRFDLISLIFHENPNHGRENY